MLNKILWGLKGKKTDRIQVLLLGHLGLWMGGSPCCVSNLKNSDVACQCR